MIQNITIRRLKKDRVCHITPLPPALPRPNELSQDLKAVLYLLVPFLSFKVHLHLPWFQSEITNNYSPK